MKLRLILTEKCNWDCSYCDCRGNDEFNMENFRLDLKVINKHFKYDTVTFSGGEPGLLHRNHIAELFHIFRDKKIQIFTNGMMFNHNLPTNIQRIYVHCNDSYACRMDQFEDIIYHRYVITNEINHFPNVKKLLLVPAINRGYTKRSRCIFTALRYELLNRGKRWISAPLIHRHRQTPCYLGDQMIFNVPKRLIKECHGKAGKRRGFGVKELANKNLHEIVNSATFCGDCWYGNEVSKLEFQEIVQKNPNDYLNHLMKEMSYTDAVSVMLKRMEDERSAKEK